MGSLSKQRNPRGNFEESRGAEHHARPRFSVQPGSDTDTMAALQRESDG